MIYDILIIGGGINGTGIAADAAGRGLSVLLCEQGDLAAATSSSSSKLIHGGLRYLEHYQLRMVRASLKERGILHTKAPHLISPLRFIIPYSKELSRPYWYQKIGLKVYDCLSGKTKVDKSRTVSLENAPEGEPLKSQYHRGFSFYDYRGDDARLVISNAIQAAENKAKILPRHQFIKADRHKDDWHITINDPQGHPLTVRAKIIVNAAGPWVEQSLAASHCASPLKIQLVKGSHIIIPQLYAGDQAYLLQNDDNRIIFVIPYMKKFTLIGTTEVDDPEAKLDGTISNAEMHYLCGSVNQYFQRQITPQDIVWSYAGWRPLIDNKNTRMSALSRDYQLYWDDKDNLAPILTVFGGKLTIYRRLAEEALNIIQKHLPHAGPSWTSTAVLPGGHLGCSSFEAFITKMTYLYSWMKPGLLLRYCDTYGSLIHRMLNDAKTMADLGDEVIPNLYQREIEYLTTQEWAQTAEDILWRRTKLGLLCRPEHVDALRSWLEQHRH